MGASFSSQGVAPNSQRRLETKDLPSLRLLGKGLSGFVYETTWQGKKYARKDFPVGSRKRELFENEASVLLKLEHPNIVKCIDYTLGKSSCSLLLEHVDADLQNDMQRRMEAQRKKNSTGSKSMLRDIDEIKRLLSEKGKKGDITRVDEGSSRVPQNGIPLPYDIHEAAGLILQIATAMKYLHDNRIVHGDLKPKNILVCSESGKMIVKVADFGLVETKKQIKLVSKRTRHFEILTWKAPELFSKLLGPVTEDSDDPFTDSDTDLDEDIRSSDDFFRSRLAMADVYSFGLLCSYILGGQLFFPGLSLTQLRKQRLDGCWHGLPPTCPEVIKDLIDSSLKYDPQTRPTFSDICTHKALLPPLALLKELTIVEQVKELTGIESLSLKQSKDCESSSTSNSTPPVLITPPVLMRPWQSSLASGEGGSSSSFASPEGDESIIDVFISHSGHDTKRFVSFLHRDLEAAGLLPFLDCKSIDIGENSWERIEHAIRKTPIAVVVFSERFAQSEWCLRELHVMLRTPSVKVVPVFYKVRPREVSFPESGQLKDGFQRLIGRFDKNVIEQWRADLKHASNIRGFVHAGAQGRLEGDLVEEIVKEILRLANKPLPVFVGDYVVGTKEVVEDIIQTIDTKEKILMLGLWGMGGIGKSTLARELYNRLRGRFDASCYIEDVTEKVLQGGVVKVQNLILKDLCKNEAHIVEDKSKGRTILEERLIKKRVLIVLDDVCDSDAMGFWITRKMLTIGSLCIITSRDRRVLFELSCSLDMNDEVHIQHVQGLSNVDSKQLFASYAFGGVSKVKPELEMMVASISKACGGVPLVLKVCGALLKNEKNVSIWNEVMDKLNIGTIMDEEKIFACLRLSYDSLQRQYQNMFLDISCALIGEPCSYAIRACAWGGIAMLGVRRLVKKALVTVDEDGRFNMHDHLRDMGREIEREGRIRRLWMPKSLVLLEEDGGLPTSLQTLIIHDHKSLTQRHRRNDLDVSHLKELRIFFCEGDFKATPSLPKNLGWFRSHIFPVIPKKNKLVILDLGSSGIQTLSESVQNASNLEVLNMSYCSKLLLLPHSFGMLKRLRDMNLEGSGIQSLPESFGELSNLGVLNLRSCCGLSSLPHSFGMLKRLRVLNLEGSGIQSLPESFGELSNLEVLNLRSCCGLSSLPHSFGMLEWLRVMNLEGSGIQSLPESFGELSNLEVLNLRSCCGLSSLPHSFGMLKRLRDMNLEGSGIQSLPESFGELSNLEVLNLRSCCGLSSLPHSFGMLKWLRDMNLEGSGIQSLPESFGGLKSLKTFNVARCSSLSYLPKSIGGLRGLTDLNLEGCGQLERLPDSIGELKSLKTLNVAGCSSLRDLNLEGCEQLEWLPDSIGELKSLKSFNVAGCSSLRYLPGSIGGLSGLTDLNLEGCGQLERLPDSIGELKSLKSFNVAGCSSLRYLPGSIGGLSGLTDLNLKGCGQLERLPDSICQLTSLKTFNVAGCSSLRYLPSEIGKLSALTTFRLDDCSRIEQLPGTIGRLTALTSLSLDGCSWLQEIPDEIGNMMGLTAFSLNGCSSLENLPHGIFCNLMALETLSMVGCSRLKCIPDDIRNLSALRTLSLTGCSSLELLPSEIGALAALTSLYLNGCSGLRHLPSEIGNLRALTTLSLKRCLRLEDLPSRIDRLISLTTLILDGCSSLEALPSEIGKLTDLKTLTLDGCSSLLELPSGTRKLVALETLSLAGCSKLVDLPYGIGNLVTLKTLNLDRWFRLKQLPHHEIGKLVHLRTLSLDGCSILEELPLEIGELKSLTTLNLNGCFRLRELPRTIGKLAGLTTFTLDRCSSLKQLPVEIGNLTSLTTLSLNHCSSLEKLPTEIGGLKALTMLSLEDCPMLKKLPQSIENLGSLRTLSKDDGPRLNDQFQIEVASRAPPSSKFSLWERVQRGFHRILKFTTLILDGSSWLELLPPGIVELTALTTLSLVGCSNLKHLPGEIGKLKALKVLIVDGCSSLKELPPGIVKMTALTTLSLVGCSNLKHIPVEIGTLKALKVLIVDGCSSLELPHEILTAWSKRLRMSLKVSGLDYRSLPRLC